MRVCTGEVGIALNRLLEETFSFSFTMLQNSNHAQQIQSAMFFGRCAQHCLQLTFRIGKISGGQELRGVTESSGSCILGTARCCNYPDAEKGDQDIEEDALTTYA
jgi:hypothetical protein